MTILWSHLCVLSSFNATISKWGGLTLVNASDGNPAYWAAKNLTVGGYNVSYSNSSGNAWRPIPTANFVVSWTAACDNLSLGPNGSACGHQGNWKGNVSTYAITGPFLSEFGCNCGPPGTSPGPLGLPRAALPTSLLGRLLIAIGVVALAAILGAAFVVRRRQIAQERTGLPGQERDHRPPPEPLPDGSDPLEDAF